MANPLVLASASPRRRELLEALGIPLIVVPTDADESLPEGEPLHDALEEVAARKARDAARRVPGHPWILAADTAVVTGKHVLGKPRGPAEAESMLRELSGRTHRVLTAVAFRNRGKEKTFTVETGVTFRSLSPAQIAWYVSTPEPYDKAGAYAVQGIGAFLVSSLRGSYTNVVGLPMAETVALLEEAGLVPWARAAEREACGA